jgi:AcrR family transcriptional regulator
MGIQERKARLFQEREQDILAAALALFRRDDWQAVTIEQIAAHAEIGKGTIYKHFNSKLEIYAALALAFQHQLLGQLRALDAGQDVLGYLRRVTRVVWDAHMASREYHRVFQFCHQEDFRHKVCPAMGERLVAMEADIMACVGAALERGVREGLFPDKPLPQLAFGARSALWGAIDLAWAGCGDVEPEDHLEQVTRFILAGLMHQDDARARGGST